MNECEESNRAIVESVIRKYAALAMARPDEPGFLFGRELAAMLGYDGLEEMSEGAVESFAGVGNPVPLAGLAPGERVLDVGSGAGLDSLLASRAVGESGSVTGIDMTPEMTKKASAAARAMGARNVRFVLGAAEEMPFEDAAFDVALSNGAINLTPRKRELLAELSRVLSPSGRLVLCDVVLSEDRLPEVMADPEQWAR